MARGLLALATAAVALAAAPAVEDGVTVLTPDNFKDVVGKDVPVFVEFYAPWCGHCKSLAPEWAALAGAFSKADGVVIAKVDADAHKELGNDYDVKGFPTLKWFPAGSLKPEDYSGGALSAAAAAAVAVAVAAAAVAAAGRVKPGSHPPAARAAAAPLLRTHRPRGSH